MLLITVLIASLAIFLISADTSWGNVLSAKRNNLVFEGRLHDYGAYALRKEQPRTMFYAVMLTCGIVGGLLLASRFGTEAAVQKAPFVSIPDWLDIEPMQIDKRKEDIIQPEKPKPQNNSAAAAAAGSADNTQVEVVDETVEPPKPITEPGQGGTDENTAAQPGGVPGGTGTGDGSADGTGNSNGTNSYKPEDWAAIMPSFPGGEEAMMKYMLSKVKYSELERERGVTGTMYISFVVHTDGSITDISLVRGIRYGEKLADKAIKAISEMPKWNPGMNGKIPVAVRYTMPVSFKLKN